MKRKPFPKFMAFPCLRRSTKPDYVPRHRFALTRCTETLVASAWSSSHSSASVVNMALSPLPAQSTTTGTMDRSQEQASHSGWRSLGSSREWPSEDAAIV